MPKKLTRSEISSTLRSVTRELIDDVESNRVYRYRWTKLPVTAKAINDGYCSDWASRARRIVGGAFIWITEDDFDRGTFHWSVREPAGWGEEVRLRDHVALRVNGRYYDAENPDGVADVLDLNFIIDRSGS